VTDALDYFAAFLVAFALNAFIVARAHLKGDPARRFLVRTYIWTLSLRFLLAVVLNLLAKNSAFAGMFWGDSSAYDSGGDFLARRWRGDPVATTAGSFLSGYGFMYFVGAVYFVFGRNQLLIQLLNGTIGSVTVLVLYAIAERLFGHGVGRWTALFMAFFPQMLFWSAGMYKDPAILLCIALCMYAVLCLRDALRLRHVALFVGAAFALLTLRFYIFYFVVAAAVGTFVFAGRASLVQRLASFFLLVGALVGGLTLGVRQDTLETQAAFMTLEQVQVTRADQAMWGRSAYGTGYDVTTPSGALQALPLGLVYLLFAPFPWAISGVRQLLTVPETLVWYALMPAFARGLVHSIRHRLREILPILVFTVTLTLAYALAQGNVGTAYRQRTQVTMFFFLFMGVGIVERRKGRLSV
jgi:4-amino-4-deoxy-L-arabinose transferase-like glycosyltransferase